MIGDFDPEDAWDDGDSFGTRLMLLVRIHESVDADPSILRRSARRSELSRLLRKLADELVDG